MAPNFHQKQAREKAKEKGLLKSEERFLCVPRCDLL